MGRSLSLATCIITPLIVLALGLIGSVITAMNVVPDAFADDIRGVLPSKFTVSPDKPGNHRIWIYQEGKFDGKTYQAEAQMPAGAKLNILDRKTGDFIPLSQLNLVNNKSLKGESAYLYGGFDTIRPGQQIDIISNGLETPTLIGISSKSEAEFIRAYLTIATIFVIALSVAIIVLVLLLHQRKKQFFERPITESY